MSTKQISTWLIVVTILLITGSSSAQITVWTPSNGVKVCTASGFQEKPMIVKDGAGGAIISWQDKRGTDYDIYAQRLDANGNVHTGWDSNGIAIGTGQGDQHSPRLISDGSGGAIIVWDRDETLSSSIWANRVDGNGSINTNWQPYGLCVCSAPGWHYEADIISARSGGAFIVWTDGRNAVDYGYDIFVQRVDGNGSIHTGWPTNGVAACHHAANQWVPRLAGDGSNGVFIVWVDQRNGENNDDIYAQHIDGNGNIHSGWNPTGLAICSANGIQDNPQIISDGAGGALITWCDQRTDSYLSDIYVQRVNSNGTFPTGWGGNGIAVCTASNDQLNPMIVGDGSGGAIITWDDDRNPSNKKDIYALRVTATGSIVTGWQNNGETVCTALDDQHYPQLIHCGSGGAIVTWQDARGGMYDIYAGRIDGNGSIHANWQRSGVPICTASYSDLKPMIVSDGTGGAIITWEANTKIYAQRLGYPHSSDLWITDHDPWWKTPDVWLDKDPAVMHKLNKIYAKVHNSGPDDAYDVKVVFSVKYFAMGIAFFGYVETDAIDVSAGGVETASIYWRPEWSGHSCIKVIVGHPDDPDVGNNITEENLGIQHPTSGTSAATDFWLHNPVEIQEAREFELILDTSDLPANWSVDLLPSGSFYLPQGDSLQGKLEVHVPVSAMPGDFGSVHVLDKALGYSLIVGGLSLDVFVVSPTGTIISLPETIGAPGDIVCVPIAVSTDSTIGLAQFVVEYDSTVIDFIRAEVGSGAPGFSIIDNPDLPFPPLAPEANDNVLTQISGGGTNFFSGSDRQVVLLYFEVVDTMFCHASILAFDRGTNKTFLTTQNLSNLDGGDILFEDGGLHVVQKRFKITGRVTYNGQGFPVAEALLTLVHEEGTTEILTDSSGLYTFGEIIQGPVILTPSKTEDIRGAIAGSDALLVLQYLAFLKTLTDHQRIAADVTEDGNVTGADALGILRYLAFFTENIGDTGKWRFIPPDTTFELVEDAAASFKDFLLGDVTLNWGLPQVSSVMSKAITSNLLKRVEISEVSLSLGDVEGIAGEQVLVSVYIQTNGNTANTLIFTVEYDSACLKYQSTLKTELSEHFMMANNGTEQGKVHIAMASVPGLQKSGDILQLFFKVIEHTQKENTALTFSRAFVNDLKVMNRTSGQVSFEGSGTEVPETFQLAQNYPNPFNAETIIRYGIPDNKGQPVHVTLNIYNINGQLVRTLVDEKKAPGYHSLNWDGTDNGHQIVASGIYFYQIRAAEFSSIKKLAVLK